MKQILCRFEYKLEVDFGNVRKMYFYTLLNDHGEAHLICKDLMNQEGVDDVEYEVVEESSY